MEKSRRELLALVQADNDLFTRLEAAWTYLREQTKNQLVTIAEAEAKEDPEYDENG